MKLLRVNDDRTQFCCWRFSNDAICVVLSSCQFIVACVALAQHVVSYLRYDKIFLCRFNQTAVPLEERSTFLAADIIIFDFGLFHKLLGVQECIANYLDGGFMRCLYCFQEMGAILLLIYVTCMKKPHPWLLLPMLFTESFYVLGLLILCLSTFNKIIIALIYELTGTLFLQFGAFAVAAIAHFFLNYVLWHYYWYVEARHKQGWTDPTAV